MNGLSVYQDVKNQYLDSVVLIENNKVFSTYKNDSYILWYILNSSIVNGKVSIDDSELLEVLVKLKVRQINICVKSKEGINCYQSYTNKYRYFLSQAKRCYEMENDYNLVVSILKNKLNYENTKGDKC